MPMSSGANGWPNSYHHVAAPQPQKPKVVVIERQAVPPPQAPPKEEYLVVRDPPPPRSPPRARSPPRRARSPPRTSQPKYREQRYRDPSPQPKSGCCGGDGLYSTGSAGAGGCCLGAGYNTPGGAFRKGRHGRNGEDGAYLLKGTGRSRCCACIVGLLAALALTGLILGLIYGVVPAIYGATGSATAAQTYPGGYYLNGVYYYPITDPPNVYYMVYGPGIPCNQYNNNTAWAALQAAQTVGVENVTYMVSDATTAVVFDTQTVPTIEYTTVLDCQDMTSQVVLANGFTLPGTTVLATLTPPTAGAGGHLGNMWTLLTVVIALKMLW